MTKFKLQIRENEGLDLLVSATQGQPNPEVFIFAGALGFIFLQYFFFNYIRVRRWDFRFLAIYIIMDFYAWVLLTDYSTEFRIKTLVFVLIYLFGFGIYQCGSFEKLIHFFSLRFRGNINKPLNFEALGAVWMAYEANYSNHLKTITGITSYNYLVFAWFIIFIFVTKEIIKKFMYFFIISMFYKYCLLQALFYVTNYFLVIGSISVLAIDRHMVHFISFYFGHYVLGWLGSYQYVDYSQKHPFLSADQFKVEKK